MSNGGAYTIPPDYTRWVDYLAAAMLIVHLAATAAMIVYSFTYPLKNTKINYYIRFINILALTSLVFSMVDYFTPGDASLAYFWEVIMYFTCTTIVLGQLEILKNFGSLSTLITVRRVRAGQIGFVVLYVICNTGLFMKVVSIGRVSSVDHWVLYPLSLLFSCTMVYEEIHNVFVCSILIGQLIALREKRNDILKHAMSQLEPSSIAIDVSDSPRVEKDEMKFVLTGYKRLVLVMALFIVWDIFASLTSVYTTLNYMTVPYSVGVVAVDLVLYHVIFVSCILYIIPSLRLEKVKVESKIRSQRLFSSRVGSNKIKTAAEVPQVTGTAKLFSDV
ncbi:hypothetical protein HDV03_000486 [Kappamyces sp. JEL0829]|nr:hypothetical protein HDV03_000486 [Kappamyces sp. JEL0829]